MSLIPETAPSHPNDPIPIEPGALSKKFVQFEIDTGSLSSLTGGESSNESSTPNTPNTDQFNASDQTPKTRERRGSTILISNGPADVRRILNDGGTQYVGKICCGGGCCFEAELKDPEQSDQVYLPVEPPKNAAYQSLGISLGALNLQSSLISTTKLPMLTVSLENIKSGSSGSSGSLALSTVHKHPPEFVTPHPPHSVFSAKIHHARSLTKPGAEKRTYHFELDVTGYPAESGDVDFVVGGAIGICIPNDETMVDEVFALLGIPKFIRDKPVLLKTSNGRWPTIWGDEQARELHTTRRELLAWCSDIQSFPPTKQMLRLLAEYAEDASEKKILLYLTSAQGQSAFCDLRTGPKITLLQLLSAFPSSKPPLDKLLSVLNTLMPRFYSLSQDPYVATQKDGLHHRTVEIAVTVHETTDWRGTQRTGVASGFLERVAKKIIEAEQHGEVNQLDLRIPMFRGLMANPLAKEFSSEGPMLLIGAGVGIAPFRGFVQRRLRSANCANKVWVLQGIRDSLVDELYRGEWGVDDDKVRKVVQSRVGKGKYVQDEVRHQSDLVWYIVNAIDGRIFVCGSTTGMGEGVEKALVDVAMEKGNMNHDEAEAFWAQKRKDGSYVAVIISFILLC